VNPDDFRQRSKAVWDAMAAGWEKKRAYMWSVSKPVSEWLIASLDVRPGQTLLELACGPGDTGLAAAPLLGPAGRLIMTDFAPNMVDAARRRGAELGLTNVQYRVMDAERMDLPDAAVDGVLCRWGTCSWQRPRWPSRRPGGFSAAEAGSASPSSGAPKEIPGPPYPPVSSSTTATWLPRLRIHRAS
jgi:SAM-dependent methyltransferase